MRKLKKLLRLLARKPYRRGLALGVAATIEHDFFLMSRSFRTVLDAGANKGQFALAVRALIPGAKILSFEPLAGPAERFRKLFHGDAQVELLRTALGRSSGEQTIHISRRVDSSSLLPIAPRQSEVFPGTESVGTETISVARLDDAVSGRVLLRPCLLKIDVQGFELELLKGAGSALAQIDDIYVELSFTPLYAGQPLAEEVCMWLREHAFEFVAMYNVAHDEQGRAVQADFHFRQRQSTAAEEYKCEN